VFDFTKLMKFEARIVVAEDLLLESNKAKAIVSREFAEKVGIKDKGYLKITRGEAVCFEVKVSEFAEGVDIVIPTGYFSSKLCKGEKRFVAEVEKCESADELH